MLLPKIDLEFAKASYDTQKKQINARPGTRAYYHEERHAWQDEKGYIFAHDISYPFLAGAMLALWNPLPMVIHLAAYAWLEIDAHYYAFKKIQQRTTSERS